MFVNKNDHIYALGIDNDSDHHDASENECKTWVRKVKTP